MNLSTWANISLVWLSLLCFINLLIPLIVAYFAVRGMNAVHNKTRSLFHTTQSYSRQLRDRADDLSEQARAPIVRARSKEAALEQTLRSLWPGNQQKSTQETNRES